MNVEQIRLQTFSNWPTDAPVEASQIAESGFFATGNGLEVQCHWCGSKINEWDYGDQVGIFLMQIGDNNHLIFNSFQSNLEFFDFFGLT